MNSNRTQHEILTSNHHHHQQEERLTSSCEKSISLLDELRLKPGESIEPVGPTLLQKVKILLIYMKHDLVFIIVYCLCTSICQTSSYSRINYNS